MKFSVLLSVYYKENPTHLKDAMESIFHQTLVPNEIVLVKDGPLNQALDDVINDYINDHKELKIVPLKKNKGLGIALGEGVKQCSNNLIARMDTDDIARQDRFEKQIRQFELHPELDVVGTWVDEFTGNKDNILSRKQMPENHDQIFLYAKRRNPVNHPTVMFKKDVVLTAGNYQHFPLFEDYHLWARMLMNGCRFYNIQESLLYFRITSQTYKRRGGIIYLKNEIKLQMFFYKMKFISFPRYILNIFIRLIFRLIPNNIRPYLYGKIAR